MFMPQPRILFRSLLLAATIVIAGTTLAGCGRNSAKNIVEGKVTIDKVPAKGVTLTLHYDDGRTFPIFVNQDGAFRARGAPVGTAKVTFTSDVREPEKIPEEFRAKYEEMLNEKKKARPEQIPADKKAEFEKRVGLFIGVAVPLRYLDKTTSNLTWEISSGTNQREFDLKKE
jgi:hypothetical protein